jgi:hypothetical protein
LKSWPPNGGKPSGTTWRLPPIGERSRPHRPTIKPRRETKGCTIIKQTALAGMQINGFAKKRKNTDPLEILSKKDVIPV